MGFFADHGANFGNLPFFIENNLGLREIKVQSASLYALMAKQAGKLSHMKEQVLKGEIGGVVFFSLINRSFESLIFCINRSFGSPFFSIDRSRSGFVFLF